MAAPDLTLTASLRPAALDARRGVVRLHPEVLTALALRPGDPVRLAGRRVTAGIVARPGRPRAPSCSTPTICCWATSASATAGR